MQDESRQALQLVNHQFSYEIEPQVNQSYPELKLFKSRAGRELQSLIIDCLPLSIAPCTDAD